MSKILSWSWKKFEILEDGAPQEIFDISAQIFKLFETRWCIDMDILIQY